MRPIDTIEFIAIACMGCPTTFDIEFSDGSTGYVKFRYGWISLRKDEGHVELASEKISDDYDGVISWEDAKAWLELQNYKVI
jgi:hypothetical protein